MLANNPTIRFSDPCLFATFAELFADMPRQASPQVAGNPRWRPTHRAPKARRLRVVSDRG